MQEEVQKALRIHKANKVLQDKNALLKKEMERMRREHQENIEDKEVRLSTALQQLEKLQDELARSKANSTSTLAFKSTTQVDQRQVIELQNQIEKLTTDFLTQKQFTQQNQQAYEQKIRLLIEEKATLQEQLQALSNSQAGSAMNTQALMQLKEEMTQSETALKKKITGLESQVQEKTATITQLQLNIQQTAHQGAEKE